MKIIQSYNNQLLELETKLSDLKSKASNWSYIRIFIFLGGFALITYLSKYLLPTQLLGVLILILILLMISVRKHIGIQNKIKRTDKSIKICKNEIDTLSGKENIYNKADKYAEKYADLSNDLNLYGSKSIFHLINRASTLFGINKLADMFVNYKHNEDIRYTQNAIKNLSNNNDWVHDFQNELLDISADDDYKRLTNFVNQESIVQKKPLFFKIMFGIDAVMVIVFALSLFLFAKFSFAIFMLMFFVNSIVNLLNMQEVNRLHMMVSNTSNDLSAFYNASLLIENKKWDSELLNKLADNNKGFSTEILKLKSLIEKFDFRLNIIVGTILNILFLWDLRIISKLDKWKSGNLNINNHLKTIGEFEALTSLAVLKYNNPDLNFAEISEKDFELSATNFYHPLINKKDVIENTYNVFNISKLDIITGPNMSGKSTFLRSIAVNMILAGMGSVVFAKKFVFTPSKVLTYLHITDSVTENISTFKAEINKLKSILEEIETSKIPTFFILDEILRGTNSHSKYNGSVAIVNKLLSLKTTGILATHDVKLGELEDTYPNNISNYSFDFIQDKNKQLIYDYKLKNGMNDRVNADIVLKELGLIM
ncbi:MAG: hypothetical protein KAG96_07635 [Ichthyobacteriaceae bacterium]|nr:hypothetical protein [Ichthyobacteriaceae bacterium]